MADELRDSPFLGERTIKFVESILATVRYSNGPASVVTPVTAFEKKLLNNQEKICKINELLDNGLVSLIREAKEFIPPHTAMRVLLYANEKGFLKEAEELVYYSYLHRIVLTDEEINEIVKEIREEPSMPVEILISLYGETPEDKKIIEPKKFNLPKDFR